MPLISVIVPVYNVEPYLCRCVDSILNQTFMDFELILVDDGSPDCCPAICDQYAEKDSRVIVIHQDNGGVSAARNAGIEWAFANSNSEWISFVDSDDWVHPEYLMRLHRAAMKFNLPVSICGSRDTHGEDPAVCLEGIKAQCWNTEQRYVYARVGSIVAWGKLYRKDLFLGIRFPYGKINEDAFVTHRLLFQSENVAVDEAPLYNYYIRQGSIMHSPWTPRRMADIEALAERCSFFRRIGATDAFRKTVISSLWVISDMISQIECKELQSKEDLKYKRILKYKLRRAIRYSKKVDTVRIRTHAYAYEAAYPYAMQMYWYGCAALRKIEVKR